MNCPIIYDNTMIRMKLIYKSNKIINVKKLNEN